MTADLSTHVRVCATRLTPTEALCKDWGDHTSGRDSPMARIGHEFQAQVSGLGVANSHIPVPEAWRGQGMQGTETDDRAYRW